MHYVHYLRTVCIIKFNYYFYINNNLKNCFTNKTLIRITLFCFDHLVKETVQKKSLCSSYQSAESAVSALTFGTTNL